MKNTIPNIDTPYVQDLLKDDQYTIIQKAQLIHSYNRNLACRETNHKLPKLMTVTEILVCIKVMIKELK